MRLDFSKLAVTALLGLLGAVQASGFQTSTAPPAREFLPHWVQADWEYRTEGSGRWMTDNSANKSENEPFDAYVLEWKWGLGKRTIKGRLIAMQEGKEVGTLFEYRLAWHPVDKVLTLSQYGSDGTLAIGTVKEIGDMKTEALQRFYLPDGTTFLFGHRVEMKDGVMLIQSFKVSEAHAWTLNRSYIWKRVS